MIGLGLGLSQHRAMSGGVADPYVPPTEDPYTPPATPPDEPTVTPDPELTDLTRIDIVDGSTVARTTNDPGTFGVSYISASLIGPEYWEFEVMNGTPAGATFAVGITTLAMPLNGIPGDRATEIAWWSDGKIRQNGVTILDLGAAGAMAKGDTGGIAIDASGNVFLWKNCVALNGGTAVGVLAPGAAIYPFVALYSARTKIGFNFSTATYNCSLPVGFYEIGATPFTAEVGQVLALNIYKIPDDAVQVGQVLGLIIYKESV